MEFLRSTEFGSVWFDQLGAPYEWISPPFGGSHFVALLVVADEHIPVEEQRRLSRLTIEHGCKYACCAGYRCETWHDSIDWEFLEKYDYKPPEALVDDVRTTGHESETIGETVEFFLDLTTRYSERKFNKFLLLFIGEDESLKAEYLKEIAAYPRPEDEEDRDDPDEA